MITSPLAGFPLETFITSDDFDPHEDLNDATFQRLRYSVPDPAGVTIIQIVDNIDNQCRYLPQNENLRIQRIQYPLRNINPMSARSTLRLNLRVRCEHTR